MAAETEENEIDGLDELFADKKFRSSYKGQSLRNARQLGYSRAAIQRIKDATSDIQIEMILLSEAKRTNLERDRELGRI